MSLTDANLAALSARADVGAPGVKADDSVVAAIATAVRPEATFDRHATVADMFDVAGASVNPVVARLVSCGGGDPIELYEDSTKVAIGRSKDIPMGYRIDNARLSSKHCLVTVTSESCVLLTDTSTNGTFLNSVRMEKGKAVELDAGDTISFLNPSLPDQDKKLEFLFQRLKAVKKIDKLKEELLCGICTQIYYKPVMALPCLHTFCAPCISEWISTKKDGDSVPCAECRADMYEVRPSHKVLSLVEHVLKSDASLKRSEEEMLALDAKNIIPVGGMVIKARPKEKKKKREREGSEDGSLDSGSFTGSDEYSDSAESSDGSALMPIAGGGFGRGMGFGRGGGFGGGFGRGGFGGGPVGPAGAVYHPMPGFAHFATPRPTTCPQCFAPAADGFQCPPHGAHIACFACKSPFPDRPLSTTPQRCAICNTAFCDLYLGGCKAPHGVGYLQPLKDHTLDELPLASLFHGNTIEQGILQRYMAGAGITTKDAWKDCLDHLADSTWQPDMTTVRGPVAADTTVCRPCCQRVFAAQLYHYRRAIPRGNLPAAVQTRSDCWYGIHCRTQHKNPEHAQRYNHVCPHEKRKE